ncbi:MAG: aminopeptidase P family protein [Verrucomicrobia bacterium]|nr:aminopeptidase P family protein [Verrucomicrobiota bacterium]
MTRENLLIVADSEHDANMLYAVGFLLPDPFVYLRTGGRSCVVMDDLDVKRVRKSALDCRVIRLNTCVRKLEREGVKKPTIARVIKTVLHEKRLKKVLVPENFPLGLARELRGLKIKVKAKEGMFFREREFKSAEEVKKISAALIMAEVGLAEGIHALKNSRIGKNGRLFYHNIPLTAEKLRSIIDIATIQAGGIANHTIVAAGSQACDPRERGHGGICANEAIILDVFPRSKKTGYFGDIARTVVRGRASEFIRRMYHAVVRAQDLVLTRVRSGSLGSQVHNAVLQFFEKEGFRTVCHNGRMEGFCHGTGRGLGLEIHEAPSIGPTSEEILKPGHVVTIEPGLYYHGVGGVRLEDVALVTPSTPRNLTKFEKVLEV